MGWLESLTSAGQTLAAITGPKTVASLIGLNGDQLQGILDSLNQPTLCYVPIQTEQLSMRRTVDVGTTMLIAQTNQKKEYITDNAAPRPRTWTISGYISSLAPAAENGLMIKPTVQTQQAILDAAADSRQPVKFKTDTGEVVDVMIQDLQIGVTAKGPGVRTVSATMIEVKVLENSFVVGASRALDKIGLKSIPVRAIANLGKGTLLTSGVVNSASSLLSKLF